MPSFALVAGAQGVKSSLFLLRSNAFRWITLFVSSQLLCKRTVSHQEYSLSFRKAPSCVETLMLCQIRTRATLATLLRNLATGPTLATCRPNVCDPRKHPSTTSTIWRWPKRLELCADTAECPQSEFLPWLSIFARFVLGFIECRQAGQSCTNSANSPPQHLSCPEATRFGDDKFRRFCRKWQSN